MAGSVISYIFSEIELNEEDENSEKCELTQATLNSIEQIWPTAHAALCERIRCRELHSGILFIHLEKEYQRVTQSSILAVETKVPIDTATTHSFPRPPGRFEGQVFDIFNQTQKYMTATEMHKFMSENGVLSIHHRPYTEDTVKNRMIGMMNCGILKNIRKDSEDGYGLANWP